MKLKSNQTRTYDGDGYKKRAACLCFRNESEEEVRRPAPEGGSPAEKGDGEGSGAEAGGCHSGAGRLGPAAVRPGRRLGGTRARGAGRPLWRSGGRLAPAGRWLRASRGQPFDSNVEMMRRCGRG